MGDFQRIDMQDAQRYMGTLAEFDADLKVMADAGLAWTMEVDGEVIGCAGLSPQWTHRAIAWTLISRHAGVHFPAIHRAVKRFLDVSPYRRIEASVDIDFPQADRWMKMLGFQYEGLMRAYRPDGADMKLYARVH